MNYRKGENAQVFLKCILLAVYFAFFSVQLLFRFNSSLNQQSLNSDSFQKYALTAWNNDCQRAADNLHGKNKTLSYLNKRFHPQEAVMIPAPGLALISYYIPVVKKFYHGHTYISGLKINRPPFRGPPIC
jgi:hypothetical protein